MNSTLKTLCIKNEEFCIKNDELCIKHDEFCIENDEAALRRMLVRRFYSGENPRHKIHQFTNLPIYRCFWVSVRWEQAATVRTRWVEMMNFVSKTRNFESKTRDFVS